MARIVSIVWYNVLPAVYGGQKGIASFNKILSAHHPLTCICSRNNAAADDLLYKVLPVLPVSKGQFMNPFCWKKIIAIVKKERATHIIAEHPYHGFAAWLAKRKTGAALIVHSHNIESLRFQQLGKYWWPLLKVYEKWVHQKADWNLFKTTEDLQYAVKEFNLSIDKCLLIPFGTDRPVIHTEAASFIRNKYGILPHEKLLLFSGTLDYTPNTDAVIDIYTKLVPLLAKTTIPFKIIVTGRNNNPALFNQYKHPAVIMAGQVDTIDWYMQAADLFINPVLTGAGIQTKTIEAIAHGCTVVTFEQMANGLPLQECGRKLLLAQRMNWDNFTTMIEKGLQETTTTSDEFYRYFSWKKIITPLTDRLEETASI